jgi:hypothetical protein
LWEHRGTDPVEGVEQKMVFDRAFTSLCSAACPRAIQLGAKPFLHSAPRTGPPPNFISGYIEKDELKGLTFCDNRDFVMPWTGIRKKEITK